MAGPTPGQVLNGRYELRRRIGGGSMGEVWRGRDLVLGRTVAVKIVLPALLDTPTFRARFVAEARVMAMMDHPGIVGVFDYGYAEADDPDTPGAAFLVMEFIEGESLDKVLARTGPLEPRFALKVLASLLDALAAVHRAGVVHRDVKPANVMLTSGGVVLADFGIARSEESLGLTAADALMGTVPYLAPELFQAETPTPAADVYAVGILGYELLSGRQPFQAASTAAVMYKHMHEPPPPLPDYVATPAAEVLWRALEKDPGRRWSDGADMGAAMRRVLAGPVEVGEEFGAEPDFGRAHAGNRSGYEDTVTDAGTRRRGRRGVAAEVAGTYAAAEGASPYEEPVGDYQEYPPLDPFTDSGGRHGRPPQEHSYGDSLDRSDQLPDSGGRHGRAAAFGEDAASDTGGRRGRAAYDETARLGLDAETARLPALPDTTRVFETEPGGRHAGVPGSDAPLSDTRLSENRLSETRLTQTPLSETPLRRRAAASGGGVGAGPAAHASGRGASPAPRTDAARRRTLVTAAVAAPALLGLTVALVMNSSGASPKSGGSGVGPGAAQPADLPTTGGTSSDLPNEPTSSSSAYYPRSASSPHGRGSGSGTATTSGSASGGANGTRSSAYSATVTSLTGPSSAASATAGPTSTPSSSGPTPPTSTSSTPDSVVVPGVVGLAESDAKSKLTGLGFRVAESPSPVGTCKVTDQSLPANSSQPYGSAIALTLNCT